MATTIQARAPDIHVLVATPSYTGTVEVDYAGALALSAFYSVYHNIMIDPRFAPGFSLVEYARNYLVAEFLESKASHLMWIDSDLYFDPKAIVRMVKRNLDVVCGIYPTKSPTASTYPYNALGPAINGLQEAERAPGGFMLFKRHVIEKVAAQCEWHEIECNGTKRDSPRMFDLMLKGTGEKGSQSELYGEDYIACARVRKAGFKVYVETDLDFKHIGRHAWTGNLQKALDANKQAGDENIAAGKKDELIKLV